VSIDVIDVIRRQAAIGQCRIERPDLAGGFRTDQMTMVATCPVADHFAMNAGAPGNRVLPVFEHQCRTALGQNEAGPVGAERPAGLRRGVFIAAGDDTERFPGADDAVSLRRIRTAGQHHRGFAATHAAESFADGDRR
jgi:hypothetical protein